MTNEDLENKDGSLEEMANKIRESRLAAANGQATKNATSDTQPKQCIYHSASRKQREVEAKRERKIKGIQQFEVLGCYSCDGYKKTCEPYQSWLKTDEEERII